MHYLRTLAMVIAGMLILTAHPAFPDSTDWSEKNTEERVRHLKESFISAVKEVDTERYKKTRAKALQQLQEDEFEMLLDALDDACEWRALAVRDALRVRHKHPDIAEDFEERLDRARKKEIETGAITACGTFPFFTMSDLFDEDLTSTDEYKALRFEAALIEQPFHCPLEDDPPPPWVTASVREQRFRGSLYKGPAGDAEQQMRMRVKMMGDSYVWCRPHIAAFTESNPEVVDEYVPELKKHYRKLSAAGLDRANSCRSLAEAISRADTEIALPVLKELRRFEREEAIPALSDNFRPWEVTVEEIENKHNEIRERRSDIRSKLREAEREEDEEAVEKLTKREEELGQQSSVLRRGKRGRIELWEKLNELIEELD